MPDSVPDSRGRHHVVVDVEGASGVELCAACPRVHGSHSRPVARPVSSESFLICPFS